MKVRVPAGELADGLAPLGGLDGDIGGGLVFAPASVTSWDEVERELVDVFTLSKEAILAHAPVVYLVDTAAVLGRASVLDSAVATGLVGAARSFAFEGRRTDDFATVISYTADQPASTLVEAVQFLVSTRSALGQVVSLGAEHVGAMLP
ncbi:hypothetical protein ACQI4L_27600 [Mycolicibacterium litorale]|uniref:hypothetical protein n=1 Tax=Mycolicibacterium litorale TaxID=758802 RepID=UPI003CFB02D9